MEDLHGWLGMGTVVRERSHLENRIDLGDYWMEDHYFNRPALPPVPLTIRRVAMWDVVREVLHKDTENYTQFNPSCLGFAKKNVEEYLLCQEIHAGLRDFFHPLFEPYGYGMIQRVGRFSVYAALGGVGCWVAEAALLYGCLPSSTPGLPHQGEYDARLDSEWSKPPGPPEQFDEYKTFVVKSVGVINDEEQLRRALVHQYPVIACSPFAFEMLPGKDGFHHILPEKAKQWNRAMVFCYFSMDPEPHVGCLNSWGDAHGSLIDFTTKEPWPIGTLRIRWEDALRYLDQGELHAYSQFVGFPAKNPDHSVDITSCTVRRNR